MAQFEGLKKWDISETDFAECLNDLEKWNIAHTEGYFYDDNDYEIGRWITICGDDRNCLEFDIDGNFQGWS